MLFATDIASRGVDFPSVDWVIQYDCPEDVSTYIHRVGRTARYKAKGNTLMFLLPSETKFIDKVKQRQIDLKKLTAAPNRQLTIKPTLQKLNAESNDLMHLAKRACVSYLKCVWLMKDKDVFQFSKIESDKFAESLGLATMPQINFANDDTVQLTGTMSRAEQRAARIQILRQKANARKQQRQQEQQKQIWDQVSEGESIGDANSDHDSNQSDKEQVSDSEDDYMVKVPKSRQTDIG